MITHHHYSFFFFFNDTATTEIYTLSLHDALPIFTFLAPPFSMWTLALLASVNRPVDSITMSTPRSFHGRSEEHTSELQSRLHLVCRLLLEKKKKHNTTTPNSRHL